MQISLAITAVTNGSQPEMVILTFIIKFLLNGFADEIICDYS